MPALLLVCLLAHAGENHHGTALHLRSSDPALTRAIAAQHAHDFPTARAQLHEYLEHHPGHAQALLVLSAVETATGQWQAARKACAPLSTQLPAWLVAACLGQSAEGMDAMRANLRLIEQRQSGFDDAAVAWAEDIARELRQRIAHGHIHPTAAHPEGKLTH